MKRILFITNFADKHQYDNKITSFSKASYEAAKRLGMEFHINTNKKVLTPDDDNIDVCYHYAGIYRNPFSKDVVKAYQELCEICRENQYDIIHCNTPIGGFLGRIVGKKYNVPRVIYQAHGFHFYKGAPLKNWLLYYPVERWLAHYTDAIITINNEDYDRAKKFKLRNNGKVYYVPGVGIDTSQYHTDRECRIEKRKELGLGVDDVALISMGDLIERKNYPVAIEAIAKAKNPKLQYFICGTGPEKEKLMILAQKRGVESQIHFLGYRNDIKELLQAADIFLFTTLQEGLSRSLMEAMASGLPCIASKIRGNTDLLNGSNGGILCDSLENYVEAIDKLVKDFSLRKQMSVNNLKAIQRYSIEEISKKIEDTYTSEFSVRGGIRLDDFIPAWIKKRIEIGIPIGATLLISVGELNENKNNQVIIKALGKIKNENLHYILCGVGNKESELKALANEENIADNVHFLGYRIDIKELMNTSDIFVMPSFREGLSRSIMEAMASGLPCIASRIRGNADLLEDEEGGFLVPVDDIDVIAEKLKSLSLDEDLQKKMSEQNLVRILDFDIEKVKEIISRIYRKELL